MKQLYSKLFAAAGAMFLSLTASASAIWTLNSKDYTVDTLFHANVGPGTTQTSLKAYGGSSLRIHYITVDLTNPNVDIRVTMGNDKVAGNGTLSTMAKNNTKEGARYFAGVNADFFSTTAPTGVPVGSTVINSEPYYAKNYSRQHFYMTSDKLPCLANVKFSGKVIKADESSTSLHSINTTRGENKMVLYTKRIGANTGTNSYGQEVALQPLDGGTISMKGSVKCRVSSNPQAAGSMAIPEGGYVLSGHGTAAEFVKTLAEGDEITLKTTSTYPETGTITQLAGGEPIILENGEITNNTTSLDHLTSLHPRTAVGYNKDRTKLVFLVVDGRSSLSAGVLSKTLGEIMRYTGCYTAMNFDGGGSSELYNIDLGVANTPSDGHERAVGNGVFAVATSPTDNEIAEIRFMDYKITLPRYGYFTPVIYGYNRYGVLISTNVTGYTLSCPEQLGEITDDGERLFTSGNGSHVLTATLNGLTATVSVTIGSAPPRMRVANVITDSFHDYTAQVVAKVGQSDMPLDNMALTWTSSNPSIATVNEAGVVHGITNGECTITGSVGEFSDSFNVSVEIPQTRHISLGLDAADWTTSSVQLSNVALSQTPEGWLAADYTIKTKRANSITLEKFSKLYSIPDSIRVVFNPGDAKITKVNLYGGGAGQYETSSTITLTPNADEPNVILFPISDITDTTDFINLPVEFSRITFSLNDAASSSHQIKILAVDGVYTKIEESASVSDIFADNTEDSSARDGIYDLRGIRINPTNLAPGLYVKVAAGKASKIFVR